MRLYKFYNNYVLTRSYEYTHVSLVALKHVYLKYISVGNKWILLYSYANTTNEDVWKVHTSRTYLNVY